jgi:acetyl-CoA carboxylase biotin carboxyl carrier protein
VSDSPDLSPDDVKEILRLVDESQFDEFELETPRLTIRFRRGETALPSTAARPARPARPAEASNGLVDVTAPMVGTFYRAAAPGEAPFVEIGSRVEEQTQVCILEVMKLMSAVVAGARGVVAEVCRSNGEAVEYGDVLFRIRPT